MKICPNCKQNADDDAMVCPHCGCVLKGKTHLSKPTNSNIQQSEPPKQRNMVLTIILWIFFLPIMATIAIIKSKKFTKGIKIGLVAAVWIVCFIIAGTNGNKNTANKSTGTDASSSTSYESTSNEVETKETEAEKVELSDLEIVTMEGHPKYYGSTAEAHSIWDSVSKGKIIFADKNDKYSDTAILTMGGYSQDEKNEVIRSLEIYFKNFSDENPIDMDTALSVASGYIPEDIISKWYEYDESYKLIPTDKEKDIYYVVSYHLTEDGSDAYYAKEHSYSGTIDIIFNVDIDEHVNTLSFAFGTPRWMGSLSQNGYEKVEWAYNFCESAATENESVGGSLEGSTDGITKLLNDYNNSAEFPITQDMIRDGAYNDTNWVTVNGISIRLVDNSKGIFVDYEVESANDTELVTVMKSFCKGMSPDMTDEQFDEAVEALRSGKYENYNNYEFCGISAVYMTTKLNNGEVRYTIKSQCVGN